MLALLGSYLRSTSTRPQEDILFLTDGKVIPLLTCGKFLRKVKNITPLKLSRGDKQFGLPFNANVSRRRNEVQP